MTKLIIMLFWGLVLYMIFKAVVRIIRQIAQSGNNNMKEHNNYNGNNEFNKQNGEVNNRKYNISSKDIVDADFTEIKSEEEKKTEK